MRTCSHDPNNGHHWGLLSQRNYIVSCAGEATAQSLILLSHFLAFLAAKTFLLMSSVIV